jgi:bacterial/archaeal transporter family-2 protein
MFAFLAIFIGALTAIQSRINGQLSVDIHNGLAAALISFAIGWTSLFFIIFTNKKERSKLATVFGALRHKKLRIWEVTGGLIGGSFVAVQSITVPSIGVALFTISVVGGQTVSSLVVDKVGLAPSGKKRITPPRIIAAIVTLISVAIAVYPDLSNSTFRFLPITAAVIVGSGVSFQQAFNGRVKVIAKSALVAAWMNFFMGSCIISIALLFKLAMGSKIGSLPNNPWLYIGGPLGLIFISVSAYIIKSLGILNFILLSVTGQLIGALACDWIAPTHKGALNGYLIFGTVLTLSSIAISRKFEPKVGESPRA